jgi:hypothetical protein
VARDAAPGHLEAHELAREALRLDGLDRARLPTKSRLVELDDPAEARLEGLVVSSMSLP